MNSKTIERGKRQVTVQPQEKPPEAGQPRVPHRRVAEPGQASPAEEQAGDAEPASSDRD